MEREELNRILIKQKIAFKASPPSFEKRLDSLKLLSDIIEENKEYFIEAVSEDFGLRAKEETLFLEIFPLQDQIRHAIKNLRNWMKRRHVTGAWFLYPSKAFYQYQPLGSVGIMGAWNYQVLLTLSPLVDAIAAGNHAILKPSEVAPRSAGIIKQVINAAYPEEYIHCVTGDASLAENFSSLPFDHLFFTGSIRVGKLIMKSAAKNLTPVTLELGGKSPAIISDSYPLKRAAKRIMAGKLFNAGQTCVAPDYVILPKNLNEEFLNSTREAVAKLYPDIVQNKQYSHIISERHHERLHAMLDDARNKGAEIVELISHQNNGDKLMTPKLIFDVTEEMELMMEEIFGPILPVVNIDSCEDAVSYVNDKPNPLALYYFDTRRKKVDWLLKNTLSGGVTINDTIYHLAQNNLPFGGVGNSGMGHYHGFDGFRNFSKKRAVMKQRRIAATDFLHPPFTDFKRKLLHYIGRFTKV
ncbi:coniferyl aldehyde dehydrogenase [Christiangramia salexigens]|uniref:Aldehyde dehydrogenase n=1 Tax=Christiangramia salexigens TaxID=1913577 RepID=A0A1L3J3Y4_9FLAO|nr:coniferyl aldehyde dehydrogenase [Christiangramia salexigens]APG59813.1 hypothetical protein LPB144_05005 [Christiangramia salexigens]